MTTVAQTEERTVHTRILRLALGEDESRDYWEFLDPSVPTGPRAIRAFEARWFGGKTLQRVRTLLAYFGARYDAYPTALAVLQRWKHMEPATRRLVCHWHLQLSDPIYRRFAGEFLETRREAVKPAFDRNVVVRWMNASYPDRWASSTIIQFASKLLSATSEAGLISPKRDPREPLYPKVPDRALEYILYLLREVEFEGSMTDNAYLRSVALAGPILEQRLSPLPSIGHRRLGDVSDIEWRYANLTTWAEATL